MKIRNRTRTLTRSGAIIALFTGAAVVLAPWTLWLFTVLPSSHVDQRWNLVWAGLDGALICSLTLTAYLTWRRSGWVVMAATAAATLLLIDAWFDTLTASAGPEHVVAVVSAIGIEIPLALLSLWVAFRAGKRYF